MLAEESIQVPSSPIADPARRPAAESRRMESNGLALVITDGEATGRYAQISDAPITVGRGGGVDLQVSDPTVSRHHCVIWRASGRCWIRDLGFTNQTRVNNQPARIAELFEGDVVIVGQTALTLASNAFGRVAG